MGFEILSSGIYIPRRLVINLELEKILKLPHGTIENLVEIKERRFCSEEETCCQMGLEATINTINSTNISPEDIGLIIFGTNTPGMEYYTFAHEFAGQLSKRLDLQVNSETIFMPGTCTLLINQMRYARRFLQENQDKYALIVTSTDQSKYLNLNDKDTSILFGDASCAMVMSYSEDKKSNFMHFNDFSGYKGLFFDSDRQLVMPNGLLVYRFVMKNIERFVKELKGTAEIDWYIFHQANGRMIKSIEEKLKIPKDKTINNYELYGNTSCCSIGIALHEAIQKNKLQKGQKVMLVSYATGFEMSGCVFEY